MLSNSGRVFGSGLQMLHAACLVALLGYGFHAGATLECPAQSLFSQPPHQDFLPSTTWISSVEHFDMKRGEGFQDLPTPFDQVRWWGYSQVAGGTFGMCTPEAEQYRILIYRDAEGLPGQLFDAFEVSAVRQPTGRMLHNANVYFFTAALPRPVDLATGWITIQSTGDPNCHLHWITTTAGNGTHIRETVGGWAVDDHSLSLCLSSSGPHTPGVRHVRPGGQDVPGGGSPNNPWGSIGYALEQIALLDEPIVLELARGAYFEEIITLIPDVTLRGPRLSPREDDPADRLVEGDMAAIIGEIIAAPGATLEDLVIEAPGENTTLLWSESPNVTVRRVMFFGTKARTPFGIVLRGPNTQITQIEECRFELLQVALDMGGPLPWLRRSVFHDQEWTHLLLRAPGAKGEVGDPGLGYVGDPNSGFNVFGDTTTGLAVVNERDEALFVQNNEWETEDEAEAAARIDSKGEVVFVPFLPVGNAILAAAVYCTVMHAVTQEPVLDAAVTLTPSSYNPVTQNVNGVYPFAAIPSGSYTLQVEHPQLGSRTRTVSVADGQTASVEMMLGSATPPPRRCFERADMTARTHAGDALLLVMLLLALGGMTRLRRP